MSACLRELFERLDSPTPKTALLGEIQVDRSTPSQTAASCHPHLRILLHGDFFACGGHAVVHGLKSSEPPSEEVGSLVPLRAFGPLAFPDPLASGNRYLTLSR